MTRVLTIALCLMALSSLAAQKECYQEGGVDGFLKQARSEGRPSIVLFNFDDKSG